MKKLLSVILAFALLLTLNACKAAWGDGQPEAGETEFVLPEDYATVLEVSINPLFRLYLDAQGNVLAVEAVNKDAKKLAQQLSFGTEHYTVAIEKIVTAANENDYIKSATVIHVEISDVKDSSIDKDDVKDEIVAIANEVAPELKLNVNVKVKGQEEEKPGETRPPQCAHDFEEATCTAPKTCKLCGETEGAAKEHDWQEASCTAPKTCKTCGQTEGTAKEHGYTGGKCSVCGSAQAGYRQLDTGVWVAQQVVGTRLYTINLTFKDRYLSAWYGSDIYNPGFDADFRDQLLQEYETSGTGLKLIDGIYYYSGMGDGGEITYTVTGDAVEVNCEGYLHLSLVRTAPDQLTLIQSDMLGEPTGVILTWQE